jgi:molecular chaperone DnaK
LLYTTEQAIEGYAELVDAALQKVLREGCARLRKLLDDGAGVDALREAYVGLEAAAFRMSEAIYG